jgi:hypothetical protein
MRVDVCEKMYCHLHVDVVYIFGTVSLQHRMIAVIHDSKKCENLCLEDPLLAYSSGKFQILLNMSLFM